MQVIITPVAANPVTITSQVEAVTISNPVTEVTMGVSTSAPPAQAITLAPTQKVAVSGDTHSTYGELAMSVGNTVAVIPGSGVIIPGSIIVSIRGMVQTDFVLGDRTITLGFTPNIDNNNRMVVQYEEI